MTELNEQALDKAAQAIGNANLSNIGVPYPASACRRDAEAAIRAYLADDIALYRHIDGLAVMANAGK